MTAIAIHRGELFDVYKVTDASGAWALKLPAAGSKATTPMFQMHAQLGGVSTVWNLMTTFSDVRSDRVAPAERGQLLADERARIDATHGAWNHEVCFFGPCRRPDDGSETWGLGTRWIEGDALSALPRRTQRAMFPRMLPALWDALTAVPHGDLHPSNLIVSPQRDRFSLIDPGATLHATTPPRGPCSGGATLMFLTHAESYPLLPPYGAAGRPAGARLAACWRGVLDSLTASARYPPVQVGNQTMMQELSGLPDLAPPLPDGRPLPAEQLAIGILYYEMLGGRSPFSLGPERRPAWASLRVLDDSITGHERGTQWATTPPQPPSALDPSVTPAEDALALALLDLQIGSRDQLLASIAQLTRG